MLFDFEFGEGVIDKYDDFDLDINLSLEKQIDLLKEDLLQVTYDNNYIIDIGWYPEFDSEGSFSISVIKEYNWDKPVSKKKCRDLNVLLVYLKEAVEFVASKRITE